MSLINISMLEMIGYEMEVIQAIQSFCPPPPISAKSLHIHTNNLQLHTPVIQKP